MISKLLTPCILLLCSQYVAGGKQEDATNKIAALKTQMHKRYDKVPGGSARIKTLERSLDKAVKKGKKIGGNMEWDSLGGAADGVMGALESFATGDPMEITKGIVEALSSVAEIFGPMGAAIAGVYAVCNGFLGFGDSSPPLAEVMRGMVKEELIASRNRELLDEYYGAMATMQSIQDNIVGIMTAEEDLKAQDLSYLSSQVGSTATLRVMGLLKSMVLREASNITSKADAKQLQENLRLYVELTAFRKSLLTLARSVFEDSELTVGAELAIDETMSSMNKNDKGWMGFFSGKTNDYDKLLLLTDMDYTGRHVTKYLRSIDIDPNRANTALDKHDGCVRVSTSKYFSEGDWVYLDGEYVRVDGNKKQAAVWRIVRSSGNNQMLFHLVDPNDPNTMIRIGQTATDTYTRTSKCGYKDCGRLYHSFNAVQVKKNKYKKSTPYMFQEIKSGGTSPLYHDGKYMYGKGDEPEKFGGSNQQWWLEGTTCIGFLKDETTYGYKKDL